MNIEEYDKYAKEGYKVVSKIAFKISDDAVNFVNSITSNDMDKNINAFLDSFGKIIALVNQKVIDNNIYLVLEKSCKNKFLDNINKYIKFSSSKIEELNLDVVHIIGDIDLDAIKFPSNIGFFMLLKDLETLKYMKEISDEDYNVLRIENNIPLQGIDFDNDMLLEVSDAVSFTKGCYPGQEIIARVSSRSKPVKKLVRILFDKLPNKVTVNNKEVGNITSSCFSPKYNKYLAFAMIKDYDKKLDYGEILD